MILDTIPVNRPSAGGSVQVHCGRIESHPDRGWQIRLPDGELITRDDGSGLSVSEAEEALDRLERYLRDKDLRDKESSR